MSALSIVYVYTRGYTCTGHGQEGNGLLTRDILAGLVITSGKKLSLMGYLDLIK